MSTKKDERSQEEYEQIVQIFRKVLGKRWTLDDVERLLETGHRVEGMEPDTALRKAADCRFHYPSGGPLRNTALDALKWGQGK